VTNVKRLVDEAVVEDWKNCVQVAEELECADCCESGMRGEEAQQMLINVGCGSSSEDKDCSQIEDDDNDDEEEIKQKVKF
jgi:hypothetical protein